MVRVHFTENIQRHVDCPPMDVEASTVREALDVVFAENPTARSYVLDDRGSLRVHMAIFVDGKLIADRVELSDEISAGEIYVMQALSGG